MTRRSSRGCTFFGTLDRMRPRAARNKGRQIVLLTRELEDESERPVEAGTREPKIAHIPPLLNDQNVLSRVEGIRLS